MYKCLRTQYNFMQETQASANNMENLIQAISFIQPVSENLRQALYASVLSRTYAKKAHLLQPGQVCNRVWFIGNGSARAYYFKEDKEVTSWFMMENDFIISVRSFFGRQPSYEYIEVLEPSELLSIDYICLQQLYNTYPEFNRVGRILTEQYYTQSEERLFQLRMNTAQNRYDTLLSTHPTIFQRASLKQIASYLGVTPETLSRMRAKR